MSGFRLKQLSLALEVPVNYFFDYPITVIDGKLCSSNVPVDNRQNVSKREPQDKQLDTKKDWMKDLIRWAPERSRGRDGEGE